jgi:hypothetical protein
MSQIWFLQYLKTFLQEYIIKFAIHNQIKKLQVSKIGHNWNKLKFHFELILETHKFLILLCIAIMTIYSCRNVFRYYKYQIWDLYEDLSIWRERSAWSLLCIGLTLEDLVVMFESTYCSILDCLYTWTSCVYVSVFTLLPVCVGLIYGWAFIFLYHTR